jgi:hypothetical protein
LIFGILAPEGRRKVLISLKHFCQKTVMAKFGFLAINSLDTSPKDSMFWKTTFLESNSPKFSMVADSEQLFQLETGVIVNCTVLRHFNEKFTKKFTILKHLQFTEHDENA